MHSTENAHPHQDQQIISDRDGAVPGCAAGRQALLSTQCESSVHTHMWVVVRSIQSETIDMLASDVSSSLLVGVYIQL